MRGAWAVICVCGWAACGSDEGRATDVAVDASPDTLAPDTLEPVDVAPTACTIEGQTFAAGTLNPANLCEECTLEATATAWSPRPTGIPCNAGKICHGGACVAECFIAGTAYAAGAPNATNPCEVCDPERSISTFLGKEDGAACPDGLCLARACVNAPAIATITPKCAPNDGSGVLAVTVSRFWPTGGAFQVAGVDVTATAIRAPFDYQLPVPALPGVTGPVDVSVRNSAGLTAVMEDAVDLFAGFGLAFAVDTKPAIIESFGVGDVDGDDHDDVVYLFSNKIHVERSALHDGTFGVDDEYKDAAYYPVAVGDFTNDGLADFVTFAAGNAQVFAGRTGQSPAFLKSTALNVDVRAMVTGHFDADNVLDIAVVRASSTKVEVFLGDGAGGFAVGPVVESSHAINYVITAGPLGGDARDDLVISQYESGQLVVALAEGEGFATPVPLVIAGLQTLDIADFDGDGHGDLLVTGGQAVSTRLYPGVGDGTFGDPVQLTSGGLSGAAAGDFNGDGHLDVVASGGPGLRLIAGRGDGTFWCAYELALDPSPYVWRTGDFDGDGHTDLVATTPNHKVLIHAMGNPPAGAPR